MKLRSSTYTAVFVALGLIVAVTMLQMQRDGGSSQDGSSRTGLAGIYGATTSAAAKHDISPALSTLMLPRSAAEKLECREALSGCGTAPTDENVLEQQQGAPPYVFPAVSAQGAAVEQTSHGLRPPVVMIESFDGHGYGLVGPHGTGRGGNPSDNSLAVGRNHIYETVNSLTAVYTKKGELFDRSGTVLFGPIGHNVVWNGFGGECERSPNGDTVVRYDQLADRWLIVMPRFNRAPAPAGSPPGTLGPYGMCYAVSVGANPLGPYYRYYFERTLFPDYPRPAIWPDGYYIPTSTGDNLLPDGRLPEKHACVVDRTKLLQGLPATEQCVIIPESNFLNNADIDGHGLPPAGAPNIMIASGGTQLRRIFSDDGIYVYTFHVDWQNPANTKVDGPVKIAVAPYNYLCDGQLTSCVPQPGVNNRLDSQGDKIMQRVVYRNINGRESIVAVHSINTSAKGGGVRWYEFRVNSNRDVVLHQQGTFAPQGDYRWMASPGMDRQGNIGFGYSFGGPNDFPGQRFVARLADDSLGRMTFRETVMIEGQASQATNLRWQDYTTLAMDPSDDCTFWYQGDYWRAGATGYTVRIGSFRAPGCLRGTVSGSAFYDSNRNGVREPNEAGVPGLQVDYTGTRHQQDAIMPPSGVLTTNQSGDFSTWLPADPAYFEPTYTLTVRRAGSSAWTRTAGGTGYWSGGAIPVKDNAYTVQLRDRDDVTHLEFGFVCSAANTGGAAATFWTGTGGRALLVANDPAPVVAVDPGRGGRGGAGGGGRGRGGGGPPAWRPIVNTTRFLANADGSRLAVSPTVPFGEAYDQLSRWLRAGGASANMSHQLSVQLAVTSFNVSFGTQSGAATVVDPVAGDWISITTLLTRVSMFVGAHPNTAAPSADRSTADTYRALLEKLNNNSAMVTPATPAGCPPIS